MNIVRRTVGGASCRIEMCRIELGRPTVDEEKSRFHVLMMPMRLFAPWPCCSADAPDILLLFFGRAGGGDGSGEMQVIGRRQASK